MAPGSWTRNSRRSPHCGLRSRGRVAVRRRWPSKSTTA
uniref:Uncharacterized protein n=1 Tax=Zea mays TaxID=4577 RepID=C4J326_MAIZE|nr:unknown [Zea mays]